MVRTLVIALLTAASCNGCPKQDFAPVKDSSVDCSTYDHEDCDPTPEQTGDMRWVRYHPEVSGVYPVPLIPTLIPTTPDQGDPDSARTPVRPTPAPPPQETPHQNGQAHCPSGVC